MIWSWREPAESLVRHLRTINLAMIPREDGQPPLLADSAAMPLPKHQSVVFRHWDGNVLEPLWPLLSDPQRARVLGRALSVIWSSDEYAAAHAAGPAPPVEPEPGFLRFTHWQIAELSRRRARSIDAEVAAFLAESDPGARGAVTSAEFQKFLSQCSAYNNQLCITSNTGRIAATMLFICQKEIEFAVGSVPQLLANPLYGSDPDQRAIAILETVSAALARAGRGKL